MPDLHDKSRGEGWLLIMRLELELWFPMNVKLRQLHLRSTSILSDSESCEAMRLPKLCAF